MPQQQENLIESAAMVLGQPRPAKIVLEVFPPMARNDRDPGFWWWSFSVVNPSTYEFTVVLRDRRLVLRY